MGEDVDLWPSGQVEQDAMWQEIETGAGEFGPVLALQPLVELFLQTVEIADVRRRIFLLRIVQFRRAPVRGLLLLGNLLAEQFAEVRTRTPVKYVTEPITLSGTFVLVRDESGGLLYRLNEATLVDK